MFGYYVLTDDVPVRSKRVVSKRFSYIYIYEKRLYIYMVYDIFVNCNCAIGLTPSGSGTVHSYTQTIH